MVKPDLISKPIRIHSRIAPNRIVYHPLECNDADEAGNPTDLTLERYRKFAEGSPGVIFVEACTVTRESRGRIRQLSAQRHNVDGLQRLVGTIRSINQDLLILFQISHDGRRCGRFSRVVSAFPTGDPDIHVLSTEELVAIEDMFAEAAWVVEQSGGDGIDFKNCNGYLASELLQPENQRSDGYGGSFENRTRFFRETLEKIRARVSPSFILGSRISKLMIPGAAPVSGPSEEEEGLSELVAFSKLMEKVGMHYVSVHVSNPNYFAGKWVQMPTDANPTDVFVHFRLSHLVKKAVNIPVMVAGYSYLRNGKNKLPAASPEERSFLYWAEKNLMDGVVDLVGVGRQALADPHFAKKILQGKDSEIQYCKTCQGCFKLVTHQERAGCTVYDKRYKESLRDLLKKTKA